MKPGWLLAAGLLVLVGLWFGVPAAGRRLGFFRVRRIELVGSRYLSVDAVVKAMHLKRNASIFDPVEPLERGVRQLPGVAEVSIARRLPGALRITVREVTPVALVSRAKGMVAIDSTGRVLPYDPSRSAPDLPVAAQADSAVARLLGRVQAFEPALFARIGAAWRDHGDVVLDVGGRRLWFTADASAEEMRAVIAVAEDLTQRGRSYTELDGRFAGQVVVRGMSARTRGAGA